MTRKPRVFNNQSWSSQHFVERAENQKSSVYSNSSVVCYGGLAIPTRIPILASIFLAT